MFVSIEFLVDRRTFQPEIRAKINHASAEMNEGNNVFGSDTMRQSQKDHLHSFGEQFDVRLCEAKAFGFGIMRKPRKDRGQGLPRILPRGNRNKISLGMAEQPAHELFTRITTRTNDGCLDGLHVTVKSQMPKRKTPPAKNQRGENGELV